MRVTLGTVESLPSGNGTPFTRHGVELVLCRHLSTVFAVENRCSHAGMPLAGGRVLGTTLYCPWHGASFDLRTGEAVSLPAITSLRTFPVVVVDGVVEIEVPNFSAEQPESR